MIRFFANNKTHCAAGQDRDATPNKFVTTTVGLLRVADGMWNTCAVVFARRDRESVSARHAHAAIAHTRTQHRGG